MGNILLSRCIMTTSRRGLLVVGLALLGVALSVQARQEKAVEPSKKVVAILADDTVTILKVATKVECFRIKPDRTNEDVKRIGGYPILAVGKEGNKDFAGRLTNVLFTDATWEG